MAGNNIKRDKVRFPLGIASYPRLATPDTKFDAAGTYSIKVIFSGAQSEKVQKILDKYHEKAKALAIEEVGVKKAGRAKDNGPGYTEELDDNDDETGNIIVNFKMKASVVSKKNGETYNFKPGVFDKYGSPINVQEVRVGSGSSVVVGAEVSEFFSAGLGYGVSLRLGAVQVLEVVESGNTSAAAWGFETEEAPEQDDDYDSQDDDSDEPDDFD